MKKQILLVIVMIEMCGILGCFYPFYVRKEIKDNYIYTTGYTDKIKSESSYQSFVFAESKESIQDRGYKYEPKSNKHYIFIGDSVKVLSHLPFRLKIKRVKIEGTTYTRYRYPNKSSMDGPVDIYVKNDTIKFMRVKRFNE